MISRAWRPAWPCPVGTVLAPLRRGAGDPTYRIERSGRSTRHWLGMRTPDGPAALAVQPLDQDGRVICHAWGDGARWAVESVPALLGGEDDWSGFDPRHPALIEARRRLPHLRLGRTGRVFEALLPAIIEQKVTGQEAFAGFRRLVRRYGEPAPGPEQGLWVPPSPQTVARVPSWEWLQMEIDSARSRAAVTAARAATPLERLGAGDPVEFDRRLRTLPGIGVWTSAEVRQRALGDPDAVSFGDYHVPKDVGWAFTGRPFDDAELAEFLEPWRPQRGRVPMLVMAAGLHRPRRGPRMAPRTHLPVR